MKCEFDPPTPRPIHVCMDLRWTYRCDCVAFRVPFVGPMYRTDNVGRGQGSARRFDLLFVAFVLADGYVWARGLPRSGSE
eukprot:4743929-Prorocentrum_lima.AAC.1